MPERYLNDRRIQRLSDGAFRAFVCATMWSVSNRTDGLLEEHDLPLIPGMSVEYVQDLIKADLLALVPEGYMLTEFSTTQTTKDQLVAAEEARIADRDRKRRERAAKRDSTPLVQKDVQRTVPGTGEPPTQDRTGQARQGQARTGQASEPSHLQSVPVLENDLQKAARESWTEAIA